MSKNFPTWAELTARERAIVLLHRRDGLSNHVLFGSKRSYTIREKNWQQARARAAIARRKREEIRLRTEGYIRLMDQPASTTF